MVANKEGNHPTSRKLRKITYREDEQNRGWLSTHQQSTYGPEGVQCRVITMAGRN